MRISSVIFTAAFILLVSITALHAASITRGPYLQNVGRHSITVMWEADAFGKGYVFYGPTEDYGCVATDNSFTLKHEVVITGLDGNFLYHYKSKTGSSGPESDDHTFHTAPSHQKPFHFVVYGDCRTDHDRHAEVVASIRMQEPEFVINTGDLVEVGIWFDDWNTFFEIERDLMYSTPYYPVFGNHEIGGGLLFWEPLFSLPKDTSGSEYYYSFNYGNSHFIVLDVVATLFNPGTAQYDWLVWDLGQARSDFRIKHIFVFSHYPPYSASNHGCNEMIQSWLCPLFEEYEVDIMFAGHDHNYERALVNDINYVVTGGGGADLYDNGWDWWTVYSEKTYHACSIRVIGDCVILEAFHTDGSVFDMLEIGSCPRKTAFQIR